MNEEQIKRVASAVLEVVNKLYQPHLSGACARIRDLEATVGIDSKAAVLRHYPEGTKAGPSGKKGGYALSEVTATRTIVAKSGDPAVGDYRVGDVIEHGLGRWEYRGHGRWRRIGDTGV